MKTFDGVLAVFAIIVVLGILTGSEFLLGLGVLLLAVIGIGVVLTLVGTLLFGRW